MRTAVLAMFLLSSRIALAHPGHGAPEVHSHSWDSGLIATAILVVLGVLYFIVKKK